MLIGLSGKKRHGKGTCAEILVREYGFTQIDFADALRGDMAVLNPIVNQNSLVPVRYSQAVERFGYERAKEKFPEIVRLLQVYGTEVGRNRISTQHWVRRWRTAMLELPAYGNIVVSDVRFSSEVKAVEASSGINDYGFIRVIRPGYVHDAVADKHSSEKLPNLPTGLTQVIQADTLAELATGLHSTMLELGLKRVTAPITPTQQ